MRTPWWMFSAVLILFLSLPGGATTQPVFAMSDLDILINGSLTDNVTVESNTSVSLGSIGEDGWSYRWIISGKSVDTWAAGPELNTTFTAGTYNITLWAGDGTNNWRTYAKIICIDSRRGSYDLEIIPGTNISNYTSGSPLEAVVNNTGSFNLTVSYNPPSGVIVYPESQSISPGHFAVFSIFLNSTGFKGNVPYTISYTDNDGTPMGVYQGNITLSVSAPLEKERNAIDPLDLIIPALAFLFLLFLGIAIYYYILPTYEEKNLDRTLENARIEKYASRDWRDDIALRIDSEEVDIISPDKPKRKSDMKESNMPPGPSVIRSPQQTFNTNVNIKDAGVYIPHPTKHGSRPKSQLPKKKKMRKR